MNSKWIRVKVSRPDETVSRAYIIYIDGEFVLSHFVIWPGQGVDATAVSCRDPDEPPYVTSSPVTDDRTLDASWDAFYAQLLEFEFGPRSK